MCRHHLYIGNPLFSLLQISFIIINIIRSLFLVLFCDVTFYEFNIIQLKRKRAQRWMNPTANLFCAPNGTDRRIMRKYQFFGMGELER